MSVRQTTSYLIRRFKEVGIRPDTRHGQNFLVDLNLLSLLAETADVTQDDVVLEVGTGTGGLTALLAQSAAWVVTFEIDAALHQLACESLVELDNVTLIQQDVLRNKNHLHPDVLQTIRDRMRQTTSSRFKLVSNLPYNIATPVVSNLLASDLVPASMTITIQKELAARMTAQPGTKDYSALSIWVQSQCHVRLVRIMPPTCFWPRPKVDSAIIQIELDTELRDRIPDRDLFHSFVRSMFFHRRKLLRRVLLSAYKGQLAKPDVDDILSQLSWSAETRAEQLSVDEIIRLFETVRGKLILLGHGESSQI